MSRPLTRRELLSGAATLAAGAALGAPAKVLASTPEWRVDLAPPPVPDALSAAADRMLGVPFAKHETVRIGIVGTGLRGRSVLGELLAIEGVRITALCDIAPEKAERASAMVVKAGQPAPKMYTNGERDFERLVAQDDIDFVYTATPWQWHTPVSLAAMRAGKHVGSEVPVATSTEDCWALVDMSEKTRRHCLMMENCCYGNSELSVLRMVREGVFGTLLHAEAAYLHDLRRILFEDKDEGLWRRSAAHEAQRQLLSDAWARTRRAVSRDSPRRPVRFHGVDGVTGGGTFRVARSEGGEGQPEVEREVRSWRHELVAHSHREGANDPAAA